MARKTIVTVDVPETATDSEFLSALWDDDSAPTLTVESIVSDCEPGTMVTDDGVVIILTTGLPDARVPLASLTRTDIAVESWRQTGKRLPRGAAYTLASALATATKDKGHAATLARLVKGEAVGKADLRAALRAADWHAVGMTAYSALVEWSGVNSK